MGVRAPKGAQGRSPAKRVGKRKDTRGHQGTPRDTKALVVVSPAAAAVVLAETAAAADEYARSALSGATRRNYGGDWRRFEHYCAQNRLEARPCSAETVRLYLTHLAQAGQRYSTIARALASICKAHKVAGQPSPRALPGVVETLRGIKNTHGARPSQKSALIVVHIQAMLAALPGDKLITLRNRALVLVGFAGAFRRSELVALDVDDLERDANGLGYRILIRRSKTDQGGLGMHKGLPVMPNPDTCPVRALEAWLTAARITSGPIFVGLTRHGKSTGKRLDGGEVARLVKKICKSAGVVDMLKDPRALNFAGHSLRAGYVTAADDAGASLQDIAKQTGHASLDMVGRYVRGKDVLRHNPLKKMKL